MKKIYKYQLQFEDDQTIVLQGKPLSVVNQDDNIVLYALFDEKEPPKNYAIHICGTGHPLPDSVVNEYIFLNTVTIRSGIWVWHIFYREI